MRIFKSPFRVALILAMVAFSQGSIANPSAQQFGRTIGTMAAGTAVSHGVSAALNTEFAKKMFGLCKANPWAVAACIAGGLGATAALVQLSTQGEYTEACQQVGGCGGGGGGDGNDDSDRTGGGGDGTTSTSRTRQTARQTIKDLKKLGYSVDEKGNVSTPKGNITPAMMAGGGRALSEAGILTPEQGAEFDKIMKEHGNKIKMVSMGGGGGGGGGSSARKPASFSDTPYDPYAGMGGFVGEKPEAAKTSGLSKNFGNDPVGIATDDLFQMVHRRYKSLSDKNTFIAE